MSYSSEVLADAPVIYYRLGETSGTTAADSSGNGNAGTYYNGVTQGTAGLLTGDTDTAATFDGTDDTVRANAAPTVSLVTVEAVIRPSASGITKQQVVATRAGFTFSTNSTQYGYWLLVNKGQLQVGALVGGVSKDTTAGPTLTAGQTYHVAMTYDGTAVRAYLNGVAVITTAATGALAPAGSVPFAVGRDSSGGTNGGLLPFGGVIDEVALYGTALPASRILAHYQASVGAAAATTGTLSGTLSPFSGALAGTSTPPPTTGTLAGSLPPAAIALAGASAPPATTGNLSGTLSPFTTALAGTSTPPGTAGTLAATLPPFTVALAGTSTLPAITGTLAATLPPFTVALAGTAPAAPPPTSGAYTDFDLSTAQLFYGSVYANGAIGDGTNGNDFSFPGFQLDPATAYQVQVDLVVPSGWTATTVRSFAVFSQGAQGPDASDWWTLGGTAVPTSGTYTFTIGPGIESWASAMAGGETWATFETGRLKVTGMRWRALAAAPSGTLAPFTIDLHGQVVVAVIYGTDTRYANDSYTYGGTAQVDYAAPVAPPPPGLVRRDVRRVHQSLPTPTLVRGRPQ